MVPSNAVIKANGVSLQSSGQWAPFTLRGTQGTIKSCTRSTSFDARFTTRPDFHTGLPSVPVLTIQTKGPCARTKTSPVLKPKCTNLSKSASAFSSARHEKIRWKSDKAETELILMLYWFSTGTDSRFKNKHLLELERLLDRALPLSQRTQVQFQHGCYEFQHPLQPSASIACMMYVVHTHTHTHTHVTMCVSGSCGGQMRVWYLLELGL